MRLWSLHPSNLDTKGLVAAWREALLAQAVFGTDRGYSKHTQLKRFDKQGIVNLLWEICAEATKRGYIFDSNKIGGARTTDKIRVTSGQIDYEVALLQSKLDKRSPGTKAKRAIASCYYEVPGGIEDWEVIK